MGLITKHVKIDKDTANYLVACVNGELPVNNNNIIFAEEFCFTNTISAEIQIRTGNPAQNFFLDMTLFSLYNSSDDDFGDEWEEVSNITDSFPPLSKEQISIGCREGINFYEAILIVEENESFLEKCGELWPNTASKIHLHTIK